MTSIFVRAIGLGSPPSYEVGYGSCRRLRKKVLPWGIEFVLGLLFFGNCFLAKASPEVSFGGIHLALSPDSRQLALSYQGAIGLLDVETGHLELKTAGPGWDVQPAWYPDGERLLFIRSSNFRVGRLFSLDLKSGEIEPRAIQARGPVRLHPDGRRAFGYFSTRGYPGRLAMLDLSTDEIRSLTQFPAGHAERVAEAFTLDTNGTALVYAIHRDRPGEQTGTRGPQAQVWRYEFKEQTSTLLGEVPSRVFRMTVGEREGEWLFVSDWGGAHYNIWRATLVDGQLKLRRITAGLADEDWPSFHPGGPLVYTDNSQNATRVVLHDLASDVRRDLRVERIEFGEPVKAIELAIECRDGAAPVGRISIRRQGGRFHFPQGSLYRITGGLGHFYGRDRVPLKLPYGQYELVAYRGTEYREVRQTLTIETETPSVIPIHFERWTRAADRGWYSGENHIHANYGYGAWYSDVRTVADQVEGEGLNVANLVVANSDGDGVFDRPFFLGRADARSTSESILYWNEEFRSTIWGHLTIVDLDQLVEPIFTGFAGTTNPWDVPTNVDVAASARVQGASVSYTHPARNPEDPYDGAYTAKGLPVDAALGVIDTLDVLGFGYDGSLPLWYRLLNCGFRIPAAAGTDCFLNRILSYPPGWGRCYVQLPDGLDYEAWIEGQREGRSFITTGPILEFTLAGKVPGENLHLSEGRTVEAKIHVRSQYPLQNVEMIVNGNAVRNPELSVDPDSLDQSFSMQVPIARTGWVAVRVSGRAPSDYVGRRQIAHTNPVYIEVAGTTMDHGDSPAYFLSWIDRLERDLEGRDRLRHRREDVRAQLKKARDVYREMITPK